MRHSAGVSRAWPRISSAESKPSHHHQRRSTKVAGRKRPSRSAEAARLGSDARGWGRRVARKPGGRGRLVRVDDGRARTDGRRRNERRDAGSAGSAVGILARHLGPRTRPRGHRPACLRAVPLARRRARHDVEDWLAAGASSASGHLRPGGVLHTARPILATLADASRIFHSPTSRNATGFRAVADVTGIPAGPARCESARATTRRQFGRSARAAESAGA